MYEKFEDYITTASPEGVGTSIDVILRLCRDDTEVVDLIDGEIKREDGEHKGNQHTVGTVNIVNSSNLKSLAPTGNTQQAGQAMG